MNATTFGIIISSLESVNRIIICCHQDSIRIIVWYDVKQSIKPSTCWSHLCSHARSSCYVLMFPAYLSLLNSSHYTIPNYPIYEQFKKDIASYIRVKVDSFSRQLDGHPKIPHRDLIVECQQPMKVCSHNISTRWVVQARLSFSLIRASASSLLVSSSSFVLINDDWLVV